MEPLESITTTITVGPQGRATLDRRDREALGIDGEEAYVQATIEVLRINGQPPEEVHGGDNRDV